MYRNRLASIGQLLVKLALDLCAVFNEQRNKDGLLQFWDLYTSSEIYVQVLFTGRIYGNAIYAWSARAMRACGWRGAQSASATLDLRSLDCWVFRDRSGRRAREAVTLRSETAWIRWSAGPTMRANWSTRWIERDLVDALSRARTEMRGFESRTERCTCVCGER